MAREPNDYALVIGINHYPDYGSQGKPLQGAIRDARAVYDWLTDDAKGGGLPQDNCELIVSSTTSLNPPQPRKDKIDDALDRLWRRYQQREQETGETPRRFYLYFSGHGQAQQDDDVALCMSNWARNREAAAISLQRYIRLVVNCMQFHEVIFWLDCCRARKIGARGQESELTCAKPHDQAGKTLKFVAHATEFQASAFEAERPGAGDDHEPIVRGHFTEALLAALNGGAAVASGGVPASQLWSYLHKVVPRIAKRYNHIQTPEIVPFTIPPGAVNEPMFGIAPKIETVDVNLTFTHQRHGMIRLEGPDLSIIHEGLVESGPWEETLEVATYLLTELATGKQQSLQLRASNQVIDVKF